MLLAEQNASRRQTSDDDPDDRTRTSMGRNLLALVHRPQAIATTPVNAIRNQCGEPLWLNSGTDVLFRGGPATVA
jgi:hypothetical protein